MKTTTGVKLTFVVLLLASVIGGAAFLAAEIDCERERDGQELVERKRRLACWTNGVSDAAEKKLDEIHEEHLRLAGTEDQQEPQDGETEQERTGR